jgi:hypothetical protein
MHGRKWWDIPVGLAVVAAVLWLLWFFTQPAVPVRAAIEPWPSAPPAAIAPAPQQALVPAQPSAVIIPPSPTGTPLVFTSEPGAPVQPAGTVAKFESEEDRADALQGMQRQRMDSAMDALNARAKRKAEAAARR